MDLDPVLADSMADSVEDSTAAESAQVVDNKVVGSAADNTAAGSVVDSMAAELALVVDNKVADSAADNTAAELALVADNKEVDLEVDDMAEATADCTAVAGTAADSAVDMVVVGLGCLAVVSDSMDPEPIAPWLQMTPRVSVPKLELIV